jgi:hypothetical protein
VTLPAKNKFDPSFAIVDQSGRPTQLYRDYLSKLDALVAAIAAGNLPVLVNAANDAAAAAAGVLVGQIYRNGSVLMMRVV